MEKGFIKASSDNLPIVDSEMINDFYTTNLNFFSVEMRNIKASRATRESYGDNAIGYVQLKREGSLCIIKGKITPEHKVYKKSYTVEAVIEENDQAVVSSECKDCAASAGGCKHGVAFLLWLHRRSEEPSPTSVTCYWKKPMLAEVKNSKMDLQSIVEKDVPVLHPLNKKIVEELTVAAPFATGGVFDICQDVDDQSLSIYQLYLRYKDTGLYSDNIQEFFNYLMSNMSEAMCEEAEKLTRTQSKSTYWYELRFGRITASRIYEAARCKTISGSLTEAILGASKVPETDAVIRGKKLESFVLQELCKKRKFNAKNTGLFLNRKYPIFGASPDGITEDYCIEIKCPSKEKSVQKYIEAGEIKPKFFYQMQCQMLFCNKEKGLFCVASPNFEENKEIQIYEVQLEKEKCLEIMELATDFWKNAIFPVISRM